MIITEDIKEMVWQAFQLEMKSSDIFTTQNWNNICEFAPIITVKYSQITGLSPGQIRALIKQNVSLGCVKQTIFQEGFALLLESVKDANKNGRPHSLSN